MQDECVMCAIRTHMKTSQHGNMETMRRWKKNTQHKHITRCTHQMMQDTISIPHTTPPCPMQLLNITDDCISYNISIHALALSQHLPLTCSSLPPGLCAQTSTLQDRPSHMLFAGTSAVARSLTDPGQGGRDNTR